MRATFSATSALASLLLYAGLAFAQPATELCNPPCAADESCVDGRCTATPGAMTPPSTYAPSPPPAAEAPPPAPPPARQRPVRPPAEPDVTDEDEDVEATPPPVKAERRRTGLPPRRTGLLALPFAGIHTVQGIAADDYDVGGRFGFLLGAHVSSKVSLNVETAFNILSVNTMNDGSDVSAHDLTIAFSPLFHAGGKTVEFVVGPKLGYWSDNFTIRFDRQVARASQSGWTFGANAGVFIPASEDVALGVLLSYQFISPVSTCTYGPSSTERSCGDTALFPPEILGFTVAALF